MLRYDGAHTGTLATKLKNSPQADKEVMEGKKSADRARIRTTGGRPTIPSSTGQIIHGGDGVDWWTYDK